MSSQAIAVYDERNQISVKLPLFIASTQSPNNNNNHAIESGFNAVLARNQWHRTRQGRSKFYVNH